MEKNTDQRSEIILHKLSYEEFYEAECHAHYAIQKTFCVAPPNDLEVTHVPAGTETAMDRFRCIRPPKYRGVLYGIRRKIRIRFGC